MRAARALAASMTGSGLVHVSTTKPPGAAGGAAANSEGLWAEDERKYVRVFMDVTLEEHGAKESQHARAGRLGTSEWFDTVDFEHMATDVVDRAKVLLHADFAPAGEMPVIIDNGFGGVILHEACGHGLETTSVAKGASVLCGKMGERLAESCVTAIDDGTTPTPGAHSQLTTRACRQRRQF